jgi:hypothetical protein
MPRDETLQLRGFDRALFFAPLWCCLYVAGLSLAVMIVAPFASVSDWRGAEAGGLFGLLLSGALALALRTLQRRQLRCLVLHTQRGAASNYHEVERVLAAFGWRVTHREPGNLIEARTGEGALHDGDLIAVRLRDHDVIVGSIPDPSISYSRSAAARCAAYRERVSRALRPSD